MSLVNRLEYDTVETSLRSQQWTDVDALQTVVNDLAKGVIVTDRDGQVLVFNAVARRTLGMVESLESHPIDWSTEFQCLLPDRKTVIPPEDLPLGKCQQGQEVKDLEMVIRTPGAPDGVMVRVCSKPLFDAGGVIRGVLIEFLDVVLKEVEEQMKRLVNAVEQTADSVLITSKSGRIEYVNAAFVGTTGYSREEALGQTPSLLKSGQHSDNFYRKLWTRISNGEVFRGTIVNRKKDGELYWAEQTISPMSIEGGEITHYVSVLKDITAQRRQQEQEFQIGLAREVQQRYYRQTTFRSEGFEAAASALPADLVGGDYFDVLSMPDGDLVLVVGDVSGHGFGSALIMAETRAYIRMLTQVERDVGRILECVNRALAADLDGGRHVTMILARIDPQRKTLVYASAGHVSGYLTRASGEARQVLGSNALPLGLFADASFEVSQSISLEPGDLITLVTDGVTEAASQEEHEFGAERLLEAIRESSTSSVEGIVERICGAAREFVGRQSLQDDITALVCRVLPQGP